MPIAGTCDLTARVVAPAGQIATLVATVNDGTTPATLVGTVSGTRLDSFDLRTICTGLRVVLDGADVTADLVGPVTLRESLDNPLRSASFALVGRRYSPVVTITTWTRTPVEIWFRQGVPGNIDEHLELRGYVDSCSSSADGVYSIEVGDLGLWYVKAGVCLEYQPFAGKRRGQICREIAAAAGIAVTDIPDGALYRKSYETAGGRVYELVAEVGEPEGWFWRTDNHGTLVAYTAELGEPPAAPDHVWHLADLDAPPRISPPEDMPSTWIVRGSSAVYWESEGLRTEVSEVRIYAPYAPLGAVERQLSDGSRQPMSPSSVVSERLVSLVREEATFRGELLIRRTTTEWGWYNPAHATLSTSAGGSLGAGPGPDGLYYLTVYIDSSGRAVTWIVERFVETSREIEAPSYDADGTLLATETSIYRWHRRTQAVRHASSPDFTVHGSVIGDDNVSYRDFAAGRIEDYGRAERRVITYEYAASGAEQREIEETYGFYAPRSSVEPTSPYYVVYGGTGQVDLTADRRRTERRERRQHLDASGRLQGETEVTSAWYAHPMPQGEHDWGNSQRSNADEESFRVTERRDRRFRARGPGSYEEETLREDGSRDREIRAGSPPLPRYRASAWTRLVQEAIEIIWDNDVLRAWFGSEARVLSNEHIQSDAEARAFLLRQIRRELAHEITVSRPETLARPGQTVHLIDPSQGIDDRCLLVSREVTRHPSTGEATGRYVLELPII